MTGFTPVASLAGGALIGVAAAFLLIANGRIAGVSGIAGGLLRPRAGESAWRLAFIVGLVAGPLIVVLIRGEAMVTVTPSLPLLIAAGALVGFGTRLGGGCISGHGVCGLARLSPRSIAATAIFLGVAAATVFATRHLMGA